MVPGSIRLKNQRSSMAQLQTVCFVLDFCFVDWSSMVGILESGAHLGESSQPGNGKQFILGLLMPGETNRPTKNFSRQENSVIHSNMACKAQFERENPQSFLNSTEWSADKNDHPYMCFKLFKLKASNKELSAELVRLTYNIRTDHRAQRSFVT